MKFQHKNIQGSIVEAELHDLLTGKIYPLTTKLNSSKETGHCLFSKQIKFKNISFQLVFRIDFLDWHNGDPTLDLDITNSNGKIIKKLKSCQYYHTQKSHDNGIYIYNVVTNEPIKIDREEIVLNYKFILKMRRQNTITSKARIVNSF